ADRQIAPAGRPLSSRPCPPAVRADISEEDAIQIVSKIGNGSKVRTVPPAGRRPGTLTMLLSNLCILKATIVIRDALRHETRQGEHLNRAIRIDLIRGIGWPMVVGMEAGEEKQVRNVLTSE